MLEFLLDHLPDDPLCLIFSFLPLQAVLSLSLVNKRLKQVSNKSKCWEGASLSLFDSADFEQVKLEVFGLHAGDFKQFCIKKVSQHLRFEKEEFVPIPNKKKKEWIATPLALPPEANWDISFRLAFKENGYNVWAKVTSEVPKMDLRIPSLVNILGYAEEEQNLWLLKEFCEYGSLQDIMKWKKKQLTERQIAAVAKEALLALAKLAELDYFSNHSFQPMRAAKIYLNKRLDVKLDIYMEPHEEYDKRSTQTHWIAPEVIRMDTITHKSQIWSLGITCIQLFEGKVPFFEKTAVGMMFIVTKGVLPQLDTIKYSSEFSDFIYKCLVHDQTNRSSAESLLKHDFIAKADKLDLLSLVTDN